MAYISTVNNQSHTIDTGENSDQRVITIDGTTLSIDWRHIAPLAADAKGQIGTGGRYSLLIGGKSYEVFARRIATPSEKDGFTYEVQVAGQRFEVHVEDEREKALAGSIKAHETSEAIVRAPMPGLVLGIALEVGARVERGQTVAILEAMKMENDLPSPITGKIKEIRVNKGQTVNQGDVLVVVSSEQNK
ncbi:MAG TPA: biotin/lipoyl-containing protein [Ktedonobacteraceae bacterium]|jgi:biotin carboxyl carrier protein|nr:biotin/lipoyl-containing protein [Ktedonobacteraceae bacterium]